MADPSEKLWILRIGLDRNRPNDVRHATFHIQRRDLPGLVSMASRLDGLSPISLERCSMISMPRESLRLRNRIVITGLGVVSPLGRTVDDYWQELTGEERSVDTRTDLTEGSAERPAGAADFDGKIESFGVLPDQTRKTIRKALKLMNRETQMGVAAGQQALADSTIREHYEAERIGVCFGAENVSIMPADFLSGVLACRNGNGEFDFDQWGARGLDEVDPLWLLKCLPNMPACHLAIINDLRGPGNTITQRDVAFNMAVAEACRVIKDDDADAVLVGATGTTLTTFNRMHAWLEQEVADDGDGVCRPFDRRRIRPAPAEGAGALILEDLNAALRRGARIYGEVLSASATAGVGHDGASACGRALASAIRQCLRRADLMPEAVGHVHAHGLGTPRSDLEESLAICEALGSKSREVPVVAAKSRLANSGAGAEALELIASLLALRAGHLFPISRDHEPDPECPVHPVTSCNEAAGTTFLNLNMFGRGLASCVAVGKFEE